MYHEKLKLLIVVAKVVRSTINDPPRQIDDVDKPQNRTAIRMRRTANFPEMARKFKPSLKMCQAPAA